MSSEEDEYPIDTVEGQAAGWVVRQDSEGLSASEQRAFEAWIADPAHRAAYERHRSVWERYRQSGARLPVSSRRHPQRRLPGSTASRRRIPRKLAASAIAASLALIVVGHVENWPTRLRADHATSAGERRTVTLADGSIMQLDGRSAITFDLAKDRRTLRLLEGTAFFTVAPDRTRPFTVATDAGSVTALGTAFAIRRRDGTAELVVTEHSVRVRTGQGRTAIVQEGEGVRFTADGVSSPERADVAAATAWTRGKLIVFDRPLGEVVAEIGRQRRVYWTVRGAAAAIRVNGVYDLDHPIAALDTLEKTLNLSSFRLSDRFIVLSAEAAAPIRN